MAKEFGIAVLHKLRKGDLLVSRHNNFIVLLTKQTKRYWYYFSPFLPHEGRVSKKKLISSLDSGLIDVKYGNIKSRKKQKSVDFH